MIKERDDCDSVESDDGTLDETCPANSMSTGHCESGPMSSNLVPRMNLWRLGSN